MSNAKKHHPPVWADRFLEWYCDSALLEDLQGDLYERFDKRIKTNGPFIAKLLYLWDVLRFFRPYTFKRESRGAGFLFMYKNYFKTSYRNLLKHKLNTSLNILGLAVGISSFLLITLYVQDESRYDKHYDKADRIYQVTTEIRSQTTNPHVAWTNAVLGQRAKELYPEVEETVGMVKMHGKTTVQSDQKVHTEERIYIAEKSYFRIFSNTWISGDPETALNEPDCIVITRKLAEKYFPDGDALNKALTVDRESRIVTGIIENLPEHTDLKFDALLSIGEEPISQHEEWCITYLLFHKEEDAAGFEKKLQAIYAEDLREEMKEMSVDATYHLEALPDVHFGEKKLFDTPKSSRYSLYIFTAASLCILLIACINYINLSVAQAPKRQLEVGVRKVLGAVRSQLQAQYLTESILICMISIVAAIGIVLYCLPLLNQVTSKELQFSQLISPFFFAVVLFVIIIVGLFAGSYPAFYLTSAKTSETLKGNTVLATRGRLRNVLVVIQFTASISLIVCTKVVFDQLQLLTKTDPGFKKDQVLVVDIPRDQSLYPLLPSFKNTLAELPFVKSSSLAGYNSTPSSDMDVDSYDVEYKGEWVTKAINNISVDEDYLDVLNIDVAAGRKFRTEDITAEEPFAIIVNEAFARSMEWADPVDQSVYLGSSEFTVVGVARDFYFNGFHKNIEPLLMHVGIRYPEKLLINVSQSDFTTITALEGKWKSLVKDHPFTFEFLDTYFNEQYRSEKTMQTILLYFSTLTILVACLGLFGLVAIIAAQKTREFGIRKVFGASLADICILLWKPFLLLIGISIILSIPITVFGMDRWLQRFSHKITLGAEPFLLASAGAFLTAMIAMAYHTLTTARTNPVKSIRYE